MELQTKRIFALLSSFIFILNITLHSNANAITFGQEVNNASSAFPSVVSIWYTDYASDEPNLFCTGTLIEPRIVLTAAHCIPTKGLIFIKYGANQLDDNLPLYAVSAVWRNPRYSSSQAVNDVGLLLLEKQIPGAIPFPLDSKNRIVSFQKSKSVKYRIVGWGIDQNEELPTYLRTSLVNDQTSIVKKYVRNWRDDVWFAVGKYIKSEGVYSGICSGDSGSPLFATLNGQTLIAGVASYTFAEECEVVAPSVFTRLSYYLSDISKGIQQLSANESTQNRALPSVITEPKIIGAAKTGSVLTCDPGKWSTNTTTVTSSWSGDGVPYGFSGTSLTIAANSSYYAKQFICTVTASNSNGSVVRKLSVTQNPPPVSTSRPTVSNMPTVASSSSTQVSCNSGAFNYSTSISNEWWVSDSYYTDPNTKIGTGDSINFDVAMFKGWGGKYLYCKTIASGDGGVSSSFSYGLQIPSFQRPVISSYAKITGIPTDDYKLIGSVATCSGYSWASTVTSEKVEWYVANSSQYSTGFLTGDPVLIKTGNTLVLSQSMLEAYKYKYISCVVTGENNGGKTYNYANYYVSYWNLFPPNTSGSSGSSTNTTQTPTPTPTPTATATPQNPTVNSVSILSTYGSSVVTEGGSFTCNVSLSNTNYSKIWYVWRNSNLAALASYKSPFTEVTFASVVATTTSNQLLVNSSMVPNLKDVYLECWVQVYGNSGGVVANGAHKIKLP